MRMRAGENEKVGDDLEKALYYATKFHDKIFVVKFSGEVLADEGIMDLVISDLITLKYEAGINVVVVHGGGKRISSIMDKFGLETRFIDGLRVTDEDTLEVVHAVLSDFNQKIVWNINQKGGKAIGISAVSGNLFTARKMHPDLGFVGSIEKVDGELVALFTRNGYIPVIYPIGADEEGTLLNINADHGASELACCLRAEKLIILTPVRGVLRNINDEDSLIPTLTLSEAKSILGESFITEGMKPKIESCIAAVEYGVKSAHIIGLKTHAILQEVLTEKGSGTMITNLSLKKKALPKKQ
ncbi:MAG: acetylglutamate kinase [Methanophagales archaeon]|nr:acetylglutamate kinase [Methanophagales archaeon]